MNCRRYFVSGFKKDDKLTPVITLTVYWGADKWDAPRSLHEMFDDSYSELLPYIDNYHLHLIVPNEITKFELFKTSIREVLEFIKVSEDMEQAGKLINSRDEFKQLGRDEVSTIEAFTKIKLSVDAKKGAVNMCKAWEDRKKYGMDVINKLNLCLAKDGRNDDIIKAAQDEDYQQKLIDYYGLDKKEERIEV